MILLFRYFFEKTDEDYKQYIVQWEENEDRMIYLHTNLSKTKQISSLIKEIQTNKNKDILAIRFPDKEIMNNDIIKRICEGNGIIINDGVWYPKEIWIYNPL